jgi:ABC-2 type transport system permease protein
LGNIFTLGAFFTKQMDGMRTFYFNIASFFSGEYIPLVFMSFNMRFASEILPFRYTLSFPMELLIGDVVKADIEKGFITAIIWIVFLLVIYKLLYKKSLKKYEAEGI